MDKRELADALILQLSETRMVPFGLVDYCSPFISARERDFIIAALREYAAWQDQRAEADSNGNVREPRGNAGEAQSSVLPCECHGVSPCPAAMSPSARAGGSVIDNLRRALSNTAFCFGDALSCFNELSGKEVFVNAASQEGSAPASTPVATDGYQPVAPASAAPMPEEVQREIDELHDHLDHAEAHWALTRVARLAIASTVGPCCGEYAACTLACTPRGRFLAVPEGCVVVPVAERCPHEWYQGMCIHCELLARDYRAMLVATKEKPHG